MAKGVVENITIKYINKAFENEREGDKKINPFEIEIDNTWKIIDFKREIQPTLGIPIDFIDVYNKNSLLSDEDKLNNFKNDILLITTNPQKVLEGKVKVRLYDVLSPKTFYDIEMEDTCTVEELKNELKRRAHIHIPEGKYLTIQYFKKEESEEKKEEETKEELIEIFELSKLCDMGFVCLQELHFAVKTKPKDNKKLMLLGCGTLNLNIDVNGKIKCTIQMDQEKKVNENNANIYVKTTIKDFRNVLMKNIKELENGKFKIIAAGVNYEEDNALIFGNFFNNNSIQIVQVANDA